MNSDPHDSAAWRSFGMLGAAELKTFESSAAEDPVIRDAGVEMDRLSTALAVATTPPITPEPDQLEQLRKSLGFNRAPLLRTAATLAGWILAALFATLYFAKRNQASQEAQANQPAPTPPASTPAPPDSSPSETQRLTREIRSLQDSLATLQARDQILFAPVPGHALQVVMVLTPPAANPSDLFLFESGEGISPIAEFLGDTLSDTIYAGNVIVEPEQELPATEAEATIPVRAIHGHVDTTQADQAPAEAVAEVVPLLPDYPIAIPIYDPARDAGTLVVSNLPPSGDEGVYNLWVTIEPDSDPIFIGSLPADSATGADAFDFSLGAPMIIPSSFTLTFDAPGSNPPPGETNTILLGPTIPGI